MTTPSTDSTDSDATDGETGAFIADLDGVRWVEVPGVVVLDCEWLRKNYGPHPADGGN